MPRAITPAVLAALQSQAFSPALFLQATFATETIYLWTGNVNITWGGNTWQGLGGLGSISVIEEGASIEARGITLNLSGIFNFLLADILQELQLGAPVLLYLGVFDSSGDLIPDPVLAWAGRIDQPTIEVGAETAKLSINCESRLLDMNTSVERRYTQDDQQMDFPGDLGFQFVYGIQNQTIYWGAVPNSQNNL